MPITIIQKQALEKTEELLNMLEAIRGKVGILETNMDTVWQVFQFAEQRERFGEEPRFRRRDRRRRPRTTSKAKPKAAKRARR